MRHTDVQTVTIRIPADLKVWLDDRVARYRSSQSSEVIRVLRQEAQRQAWEAAHTAALFGTVPAAVLGGVATIAIALLWMKLFPSLREVERLE